VSLFSGEVLSRATEFALPFDAACLDIKRDITLPEGGVLAAG